MDPIERAAELSGLKWPGQFGPLVVDLLATEPPSTVAVTYYAPTLAKELKTTPEELRAIFDMLDCIFL